MRNSKLKKIASRKWNGKKKSKVEDLNWKYRWERRKKESVKKECKLYINTIHVNHYITRYIVTSSRRNWLSIIVIYFWFRAKNKERRENVIKELEITERDFCRDLKLTWQAFGLDTPAMLEQRNVDVSSLFGNLSDIIEVSESFFESLQLESKNKTSVYEGNVGRYILKF